MLATLERCLHTARVYALLKPPDRPCAAAHLLEWQEYASHLGARDPDARVAHADRDPLPAGVVVARRDADGAVVGELGRVGQQVVEDLGLREVCPIR